MKSEDPGLSLTRSCRLLGFTRQAYYQHFWDQQEKKVEHELVLQEVQRIRKEHPSIGSRKLHIMLHDFLKEHQIKMGRDALFNLLSQHYMLIRKRKRRVYTTQSNHWLKKYPNLIKDKEISKANQVWVSDITYLKINSGFVYISLITDAYSHKIVGYDLSDNLEAIHASNALQMAISNAINSNFSLDELIHHSDRGIQYCSHAYIDILQNNDIKISMSDKGKPLQNSIAERINGILKYEYLFHYQIDDKHQAKQLLEKIVYSYNYNRPHLSCNMLTPIQAHLSQSKLKRLWKNYYKKLEPVNQF